MPDIRNFFGVKGSQGTASSQDKTALKKENATGALKRKRTGVKHEKDDSDDEDYQEGSKMTSPKKPTPQKRIKKESPKAEETTTSDYFQSSSKAKPTRTSAAKSRRSTDNSKQVETPTTPSPKKPAANRAAKKIKAPERATNRRASARAKKPTTYAELPDPVENDGLDSDKDAGDDIHSAAFKGRRGKGDDDYEEDDPEEDEGFEPRPTSPKRSKRKPSFHVEVKSAKRPRDVDPMDLDVENGNVMVGKIKTESAPKPVNDRGKSVKKPTVKQISSNPEGSEDNEPTTPVVKKTSSKLPSATKNPSPKKTRTPAQKKDVAESKEIRDILDSIPTVPLPSVAPPSAAPGKFSFQAHAQHSAPPAGAGSKDLPTGADNCLAGLSFVFTGILETLGREEGQELVKRYGGKVMTAPSSKTNYVVLGSEAGPKKIETIRKNNIPTINEDGLFELIRKLPANGGDSKAAAKHEEKMQKEEQKVRDMAAQMEQEERKLASAAVAAGPKAGKGMPATSSSAIESRLWTVKYAPTAMNQICGNKGQVEKLQKWLREWPKNQRISFKKAGPDGSFCFRAVLIHGPPGIGKTTAAHLVAKMEGYDILESNASDTRSKKLVETGLKGILDNTSLLGYFAANDKKVEASKKKLVLIMDEVDGMSAGDRGGVGALAQVCKKTNIPMILICNERRLPKMKPFDFVTYDLAFRRPTLNDIRSRIASICFREGLKLPTQVIDALIEGSHADIRQIINMISTAKLDQEAMSFDEGKSMSKAWEKHVILKPWDITHKLLSSGMFGANSNKTLNDKIELYFNDHEFSYLMIQENYLKTRPSIANGYSNNRERTLKSLELFDKAAESISDGDLVDRMIHGPQQQWSLMPTHAVFSTVRPASFIYGSLQGQASFTSWLGNNSKQGKLSRFVKEIQSHMRLRSSGDRHEIRQQYLPALWFEMIRKLQVEGKEAVDDVIQLMDSYFLTKEDFDAIMELGVGPMDMEQVKIESQTKATFTRLYNQQSHPLPFMKASTIAAPKKLSRDKPDLEEAIEESEDDEELTADKDVKNEEDSEGDLDLSKDKYVKQPKKRGAPKKAAAKQAPTKKKTKGKKQEDSDEDEDLDDPEEDDKPAKGSKAKAKSKASGGENKTKK